MLIRNYYQVFEVQAKVGDCPQSVFPNSSAHVR